MKRNQVVRVLIGLIVSVPMLSIATEIAQVHAAPNTDAVVGPPCGEAQFDAASATVQASAGGTITFNCGGTTTITFTFIKTISKNVVIDGGTLGTITLSGGNSAALFQVFFGHQLTLLNITLANSSSNQQGAVENFGTLTLNNCTLTNNRAVGVSGGAITNHGALSVTNCTFSNNRSTKSGNGGGGAIFVNGGATAAINSTTVFSNSAESYGGGIYNQGTITLTNSTLSSNAVLTTTTTAWGGGAYNSGQFTMIGGNVASNRTLSNTLELWTGGGLFNDGSSTLLGAMDLTGVTIQYNNAGDAGGVENFDGTLTLRQTTVFSNSSGVTGGGLVNVGSSAILKIYNSQITHNASYLGGALYQSGTGASTVISQTRVSMNTAVGGGGIRNYSGSSLSIYQSLVDNNSAIGSGVFAQGGAIANRGGLYAENTTFSGNVADDNLGGSAGGAIFSENSTSSVTLVNVTISDNKANTAGSLRTTTSGGGAAAESSNTIFTNSRDPDTNALNDNCAVVSMIDQHGNIESTNSCLLAASLTDTNPLLGPLANNGGPTLSYMPQSGSPAINGGTGLISCPSVDQRGFVRPNTISNPCDSGSVEVGPMLYLPLIMK